MATGLKHIARNGKLVDCEASSAETCRAVGAKHFTAEEVKHLQDGKGFTSVDEVFEAVKTKQTIKTRKQAYDKEKWLKEKEEKLTKIHEELQEQIKNLSTDEGWTKYLNTMSQFHKYSWGNQLLIALQKPNATQVAGYNAWKKLKNPVKRGEKGITILAPRVVKTTITDDNGNPMYDDQGNELKNTNVVGFMGVTVFDVSQTQDGKIPNAPVLSEKAPEGFKEDLETAIKDSGFTIEYSTINNGADGYTDYSNKKVVVSTFASPEQQVGILAHELGHISAGHKNEASAYHTGRGGQRGRMEVEAESIAYVLMRSNGMSPDAGKESKGYVSVWANRQKEDGTKVVEESAEKVAKTVATLLDNFKWRNITV